VAGTDIELTNAAGNITITQNIDASTSQGNVIVDAAAGQIIDGGASILLNTGDLLLQAGTGIGATGAGSEIEVQGLTDFAAETNTGGIFVNNTTSGNVDINTVTDSDGANIIGVTATSGNIEISSTLNDITITDAISTSNDVDINSASEILDNGIGAGDTNTDVAAAGITFTAPDGVGEATTPADVGAIDTSLGAGTLTVDTSGGTTGSDIYINEANALNTSQLDITTDAGNAETVQIIAAAGVTINDTDAGTSSMDNADTLQLTGPVTVDFAVVDTTGNVNLNLDGATTVVNQSTSIDTGTGSLTFGGTVTATGFDLAATSAATSLNGNVDGQTITFSGGTVSIDADTIINSTTSTVNFNSTVIGNSALAIDVSDTPVNPHDSQ